MHDAQDRLHGLWQDVAADSRVGIGNLVCHYRFRNPVLRGRCREHRLRLKIEMFLPAREVVMFCQKCGAEMAAPARPCAKCGYQRHGAGWLIGKIIKAALLAVGVIAVGGMLAIYTGAKKGISGNAAQAQLAATPIQHFRDIGPETIVVAPRQVESIAVTVSGAMQATRIIGAFRAEGGGNDIRALILGGDGWINFMNGNQFKDYYDSGDVTVDRFDAGPLRAGTYRIAFSNTAILTNKVVTVAARVVWYQ